MNGVFWVVDLIIPVMLVILSFGFRNVQAGPVDNWVGYRTRRSRSSPEAWAFAQNEMGKWLLRMGIIGIAVTVADKLLIPWEPFILSMVNMGIQVLLIIAIIPIIENKLKSKFNV